MVHVRFKKCTSAVSWFPFLNCFPKTIQRNEFFNMSRNKFKAKKDETVLQYRYILYLL